MSFGVKLKEIRKEKHLSQKALAEMLGMTQSAVYLWENDKREPDFFAIRKICEIFDVNPNWLLGLSEIKKGAAAANDERQNMIDYINEEIRGMTDGEFERFYKAFQVLFGESTK